jgi:hypothetical protein
MPTPWADGDDLTPTNLNARIPSWKVGPGANVYFVRTNGDDTEDGLTWETAFATPAQAAATLTGEGTIFFGPGTYDISATLPWHDQANWSGFPHTREDGGGSSVVRFSWTGTAGGTMMQTDAPATAAFHHGFMEGIRFEGNSSAGLGIDIRNRVDFLSGWRYCQWSNIVGDALHFKRGATNFYLRDSRFDDILSWCFHFDYDTTGDVNGVIDTVTCDFSTTGTSGSGQGFILFDFEDVAASPTAILACRNVNIETNTNLENWVAAQGDTDKAVIAVGHNNTYAENGNRINVWLSLDRFNVGGGASVGNMACVKLSNTADYLYVKFDNVNFARTGMTAPLRFIDNTTTPFRAIEDYTIHTVSGIFSPFDRAGGTPSGVHTATFFVGDAIFSKLVTIPVATGSLPAANANLNGLILIEDGGAGDQNLVIYSDGQRFRIDGGAAF